MIFHNLDVLLRDPIAFLIHTGSILLILVASITIHEFSHAFVANSLGDPTARNLGRLSLNPKVHLDPMGGLAILLVGFGWGKPVPVQPWNMKIDPLRGLSLVAIAGPVSNVIFATALAIPFRSGMLSWPGTNPFQSNAVEELLYLGVVINLMLAVFNLIPIAPLDGGNVLAGILPRSMTTRFGQLQRWGPGILFSVIFIDIIFNVGILWRILGPGISFLGKIFVGLPL